MTRQNFEKSKDTTPHKLPDVLAPGLRVVFCGTAASTVSAARQSYYAHSQNKFWRILHETGLVPVPLRTDQFRMLLEHRIGLTDLIKGHAGMDHQVPLSQQRSAARDRLTRSIAQYQPRYLAFTSLRAGREYLGGGRGFGEQRESVGETKIWILPSTSGAANGSWRPEVWHAFARAVRG